jgi:hypothetical protein
MTVHGQRNVTLWNAVACCIRMIYNASCAGKTRYVPAIPDASITQYECPDVECICRCHAKDCDMAV